MKSPKARRNAAGALAVLAVLLTLAISPAAGAVRVKDITSIEGIRPNQLYGFGLVFGLAGTGGDSDFTADIATNMLERMRVGRGISEIDATNIAAVIVTAELPPFALKGTAIDVTVSAFDETASLRGGTLVLTPLYGADGQVYAVAQGPVSVGGFAFGGAAAAAQQGHPTVGRVPNGAIVEREVGTTFIEEGTFTLSLHAPDFATATRIASAIEDGTRAAARVVDAGTLRVALPLTVDPNETMALISAIQMLSVVPDSKAIVVINERTGTVVAGQNVSISTVAIAHGNLTVIIQELDQVVQPAPFSRGTTTTVPRTDIEVIETPLPQPSRGEEYLTVLDQSTTVSEVARALNLLGASPRDIISIFQAMKEAGALHAEIRIM